MTGTHQLKFNKWVTNSIAKRQEELVFLSCFVFTEKLKWKWKCSFRMLAPTSQPKWPKFCWDASRGRGTISLTPAASFLLYTKLFLQTLMIPENTEEIRAACNPAVIWHFSLRSCREQHRLGVGAGARGAAPDTRHKEGIWVTKGRAEKACSVRNNPYLPLPSVAVPLA